MPRSIAMAAFGWRRFPLYLIATMLLVAGVNVLFIVRAVSTFPGAAADDEFGINNRYDRILEQAARESALGWRVTVAAHDGTIGLGLAAKDGAQLAGAAIIATASRPIGTAPASPITFSERAPGQYGSAATLAAGQWDLTLAINNAGNTLHTTRRIVVP